VERLRAWAEAHGVSLLEVAIGGLLAVKPVVSVIAGATKPDQVRANAAAGAWEPTPAELDELLAL
jgi:aryl-alcohol dehydrogenase-like predicted oxidoreductase